MELAPGPVDMRPEILRVGGSQPSYFRTERFSEWLLALKAKFLRVLGVGQDHELIFLTGSGTAGMEAVAVNFAPDPDLLLISSGPFGDRMAEMLNRRRARFDLARLDPTQSPEVNLAKIALTRRTACFATICETSNGYFLDPSAVRAAGLPEAALLLCDGISAAFSDKFDVSALDVLIIGSQKGLGLLPGMSFVLLSPKAVDVLQRRECDSLYYDFNLYIKNLKRGQTPFTPALTILQQLDLMLDHITRIGGLVALTAFRQSLAERFRSRIRRHGIRYIDQHVSNSVTVVDTNALDAEKIARTLYDDYNITVATNAPPFHKTRFRVSHMGNNTLDEMDKAGDAIWSCIKELS